MSVHFIDEYRHPAQACPGCGHALNASGQAQGLPGPPELGSLSVCIRCGSILEFGEGLRLRLLTDDKLRLLPPEDRDVLARMQEQIKRLAD